jgi:hypothetical protein
MGLLGPYINKGENAKHQFPYTLNPTEFAELVEWKRTRGPAHIWASWSFCE